MESVKKPAQKNPVEILIEVANSKLWPKQLQILKNKRSQLGNWKKDQFSHNNIVVLFFHANQNSLISTSIWGML